MEESAHEPKLQLLTGGLTNNLGLGTFVTAIMSGTMRSSRFCDEAALYTSGAVCRSNSTKIGKIRISEAAWQLL